LKVIVRPNVTHFFFVVGTSYRLCFLFICLIKRYAAPICADVEYTLGSHDKPDIKRKVFEHYCNLNLTKICIINFGFVFLHSSKLKLEECLLCCGVVVVSCMGEMKLNLLNLVWMNLKYIWFYIYIYIIFLIILVFFLYKKSYLLFLIRWVPPWSRRIFCNQRDWEGDILTLLSCFSKLETLPVI